MTTMNYGTVPGRRPAARAGEKKQPRQPITGMLKPKEEDQRARPVVDRRPSKPRS